MNVGDADKVMDDTANYYVHLVTRCVHELVNYPVVSYGILIGVFYLCYQSCVCCGSSVSTSAEISFLCLVECGRNHNRKQFIFTCFRFLMPHKIDQVEFNK